MAEAYYDFLSYVNTNHRTWTIYCRTFADGKPIQKTRQPELCDFSRLIGVQAAENHAVHG
jgi:hypothetical protein